MEMQDLAIPEDAMCIDRTWFEALLRAHGHETSIHSVSVTPIGNGLMGSNVRYCFQYADAGSNAPNSLIGKFAAFSNREIESEGVAEAYLSEVRFYQHLAAKVQDIAPIPWFADVDERSGRFAIILEDLNPLRSIALVDGCTREEAEVSMLMAARLHASHWQDQSLRALPWLMEGQSQQADALTKDVFRTCWAKFQRRFEQRITARQHALVNRFLEAYSQWRTGCDSPVCLVHRDYRLENVVFGAPGAPRKAAVVDWALVALAPLAIDAAYFIGTGLDESLRRENEDALLETYHEALVAQGIKDYSLTAFKQHYAWYSFWGIMVAIGSMMFAATEDGDAMLHAMFRRQANLILDNGYIDIF